MTLYTELIELLNEVIVLKRWTVQDFMMTSFAIQIILVAFGSCRRRSSSNFLRIMVWLAYNLVDTVCTYGLSRAASLSDWKTQHSNENPAHKAKIAMASLLAPLFLMHLGLPDSITAYAIADCCVGWRSFLVLGFQIWNVFGYVYYCWTDLPMSYLAISVFIAGLINFVLKGVSVISSLRTSDELLAGMIDEDKEIPNFDALSSSICPNGSELLLKAYYRFTHLKPHIDEWFYPREFIDSPVISIDHYPAEEVFKITEIELSFMYDALYTKARCLSTKTGYVLSFLRWLCLVITLYLFPYLSIGFYDEPSSNKLWVKTKMTFSLLLLAVFLETYEAFRLLLSDWTIVHIIKQQLLGPPCFLSRSLRVLGQDFLLRKRSSNQVKQLNLIEYCTSLKHSTCTVIPETLMTLFGGKKKLRSIRGEKSTMTKEIELYLKRVVRNEMEAVELVRKKRPFDRRGDWALKRHGLPELNWTIYTEFSRSITLWHIATEICYHSDAHNNADPDRKESCKELSNYMMYLLFVEPRMLSVYVATTTDLIVEQTVTKLVKYFEHKNFKGQTPAACEALLKADEMFDNHSSKEDKLVEKCEWHGK